MQAGQHLFETIFVVVVQALSRQSFVEKSEIVVETEGKAAKRFLVSAIVEIAVDETSILECPSPFVSYTILICPHFAVRLELR